MEKGAKVIAKGKVGVVVGEDTYVDYDGDDDDGCPIYRKLHYIEVEFENKTRESYLENELIEL